MKGTISITASDVGGYNRIGCNVAINDVGALDKVNLVNAFANAIELNKSFLDPNASREDKIISKEIIGLSVVSMITGKSYDELTKDFDVRSLVKFGGALVEALVEAVEHALIKKDAPSDIMNVLKNCE